MMWNREVISKLKGPERDSVENQRQKTRKCQWPDSKCAFSALSNRHRNGELGCPDPRSYWRAARWGEHTKIKALAHAHSTAVFARVAMSQLKLFPLKTHPLHLLACEREISSQFPALSQAPVWRWVCASGNLDTRRRLCCALNAWWAVSVPWYPAAGVFVPVCKTAWSE